LTIYVEKFLFARKGRNINLWNGFIEQKARGNIAIVKGKIHVDVKDVKNLITSLSFM